MAKHNFHEKSKCSGQIEALEASIPKKIDSHARILLENKLHTQTTLFINPLIYQSISKQMKQKSRMERRVSKHFEFWMFPINSRTTFF